MNEWICTDDDSLLHLRRNDDGSYDCVEMVWLDLCEGDEGYPDKEYVVKTDLINPSDYTEKEKEIAVSARYPDSTLDELRMEWGDLFDGLIAECIFEDMMKTTPTVYGMMTKAEAEKFIKEYIEKGV